MVSQGRRERRPERTRPRTEPERLTLIFNLTIAALTAALVVSLARVRTRQRRLERRGISDRGDLAWRALVIVVVNFTIPGLLVFVWLNVPAWGTLVQFQPDVVYWVVAVAMSLLSKGIVELSFAAAVFRAARHAHPLSVPAHVPVPRH